MLIEQSSHVHRCNSLISTCRPTSNRITRMTFQNPVWCACVAYRNLAGARWLGKHILLLADEGTLNVIDWWLCVWMYHSISAWKLKQTCKVPHVDIVSLILKCWGMKSDNNAVLCLTYECLRIDYIHDDYVAVSERRWNKLGSSTIPTNVFEGFMSRLALRSASDQ